MTTGFYSQATFSPPNDAAVEQAVVGLMLVSPECLRNAVDSVGVDDFFDPANAIWAKELLWMQHNQQPVEAESIKRRLEETNQWDKAGGYYRFAEIISYPSVVACFPSYVARLKLIAMRRNACSAMCDAIVQLRDPDTEATAACIGTIAKLEKITESTNETGSLPPILSARELIANPPPQPCEIIEGVLHQGSKLVLGGGSKSYKTWCLLDMAISVASGTEWWGRHTLQGKVLYINFEIQGGFFQQRIAVVCKAKDIDVPSDLYVWNLRGNAESISLLLPGILQQTKKKGYRLIVVDPFYKIIGECDENSATAMGLVMNQLERIATQSGSAIAFGAHFAKGNAAKKASMDRISGSGVFARDPDAILTLTRATGEDGEEETFFAEATLRNHAPIPPFGLHWEFPLMVYAPDVDAVEAIRKSNSRTQYSQDDVLEALDQECLPYGDLAEKCKEDCGMSARTFKTLFSKLRAAELVKKEGKGWRVVES